MPAAAAQPGVTSATVAAASCHVTMPATASMITTNHGPGNAGAAQRACSQPGSGAGSGARTRSSRPRLQRRNRAFDRYSDHQPAAHGSAMPTTSVAAVASVCSRQGHSVREGLLSAPSAVEPGDPAALWAQQRQQQGQGQGQGRGQV